MKGNGYSRGELIREASLTESDLGEVLKCRRAHNRLGFGYQIGFVRLLNRFPTQQPIDVHDELLKFMATQLDVDAAHINEYAARQHTVSEHQARVREHLGVRNFGEDETKALEEFLFQEAYRLEQTAALLARAREFLKEQGILLPAAYALQRIIGEQRKLARTEIFEKIAAGLPVELSSTLGELLEVEDGKRISRLQRIKENPKKPSPDAMLSLIEKLHEIERIGILHLDLSWLNNMGPNGPILHLLGIRAHNGVRRTETVGFIQRKKPVLSCESGPGKDFQDRVYFELYVSASAADPDSARAAEG